MIEYSIIDNKNEIVTQCDIITIIGISLHWSNRVVSEDHFTAITDAEKCACLYLNNENYEVKMK